MLFVAFKRNIINSILSVSLLFVASCAPKLGGDDYNVRGVGEINTILKGVIISDRIVTLRPDYESNIGSKSGAIAGLLSVNSKNYSWPGAIVGGIAGGTLGATIEEKLQEQKGKEYHIKLTNGKIISIAQGKKPVLAVGQKVLIIKSDRDRTRIIPDNTN